MGFEACSLVENVGVDVGGVCVTGVLVAGGGDVAGGGMGSGVGGSLFPWPRQRRLAVDFGERPR